MSDSKTSAPARDYPFKDAEMLIGGSTIVDVAIAHKDILQKKRSNWTDDYLSGLKARIDKAAKDYLGADSAKALRKATADLKALITPTLRNLSELKVQIEDDFCKTPERRDELLKTLGYADFYKAANRNGDQQALSSLLSRFSQNMSAGLKKEIVAKGVAQSTIDEIVKSAQPIMDANVIQEGEKGKRPGSTKEVVAEFNAIYEEVSSLAKLSAKFLRDDKIAKDQFSFSKTVRAISGKAARVKAKKDKEAKV